ncbi:MAG: hypothetical protein ACP5SG_04425 [Dissulfurimicrobium sp.]|uniref:hypothetical protein n=1 Tax=Dissulfurimicrobium hydrothermale TaxID=1750598 RepID=UPI003C756C8C
MAQAELALSQQGTTLFAKAVHFSLRSGGHFFYFPAWSELQEFFIPGMLIPSS